MELIEIVRIKFRWPGKMHEFANPNGFGLKRKEKVIVKGFDGTEMLGTVSVEPRIREKRKEDSELTEVLRLATDRDLELSSTTDKFKTEVKKFFQTRLASRELTGVKMVDCEKTQGGRKLIIYYSSENKRFDYKGMSKEMAQRFGARVDLRAVGIRDAAKLAGGIGRCGLSTCCSTWLPEFQPVSIKMAKDQGLSLDPEGINGQCGRLLCCLGYEHENYVAFGKSLPKMGKMVISPIGDGRVIQLDILKQLVTVRNELGKTETFKADEVTRKFGPGAPQAKAAEPAKKTAPQNKEQNKRNSKGSNSRPPKSAGGRGNNKNSGRSSNNNQNSNNRNQNKPVSKTPNKSGDDKK